MPRRFKPDDRVVYRKQKFSVHPGPNATDIWASESGEGYSYFVEKRYCVIVANERDGYIRIRTQKGKEVLLREDDPSLRRPGWWERIFYRSRYPAADAAPSALPGKIAE